MDTAFEILDQQEQGRTSILAQIQGGLVFSCPTTDVFVLTEKIHQREDSHRQSFM